MNRRNVLREIEVNVQYGATLLYRTTRKSTEESREYHTEASTLLWGGNKCTFEPVVERREDAWSISAACIA